jgi:pimeloyl-ACP methyl ester carboxylesterase
MLSLWPFFKDKVPGVLQKYKELKLRNSSRQYLRIVQTMMAAMANPPDLRQLKCATLIIAAQYDSLTAVDAVFSMAKAIPDAAVRVLPTGHASAIEAPEAFNQAVLKFINKL